MLNSICNVAFDRLDFTTPILRAVRGRNGEQLINHYRMYQGTALLGVLSIDK
jgi:hypothetical protein